MNLNIVNDYDSIITFLQDTSQQLIKYNSIKADDLKLLCYIVYKQNTIKNIDEIQPYLITTLGHINQETKVYFNKNYDLDNFDEILKGYINNNLESVLNNK